MIYDFIVGVKLTKSHCRVLAFERTEMDPADKVAIYKHLSDVVSNSLITSLDIPNIDKIKELITVIENNLRSGNLEVVDSAFDSIAYMGLETGAYRRDDLMTATSEPRMVRAYIVNVKIENIDERISPALGIATDDIKLASTNDIIMETFRTKLRLDPRIESILGIETQLSNWELMTSAGAGYEYDSSRLQTLLEDMGYKVKIFLG